MLAAVFTVGGAVALYGCQKAEQPHTEHNYKTEWSWDESGTKHWHGCDYEGCNSTKNYEDHTFTETTTATCTADGVKTIKCTVCGYEKQEAQSAFGHDWDEENPVEEATSHLGTCTAKGCEEVAPIEKPHNFKTEPVDDFTVSKCEDCGAEFAEVKVNLLKRSSSTQTAPYFNANVKVSLYKMGDGKYTKVAEAAAEDKSGVKLTVKDADGTIVAEGVTDSEGQFTAELPFAEYQVFVDESTLPANFSTISSVTTVPTATGSNNKSTLDTKTNTVTWVVATLKELLDVDATVKNGTAAVEGIVVKLYYKGELKFTSNATDAEGKTSLTGMSGESYDIVLEGLPAYTVCNTTTCRISSGRAVNIKLTFSADFAITLKDGNGNAIEGATVGLYTLAWNSRNAKFTETLKASGVTAEDGTVTVPCALGTYYIGAVGADGVKYWCNAAVTADTAGQNVVQEVTMGVYDTAVYTANSYSGFDTARDNLGTDVLTIVYSQGSYSHEEEFSFGTLTAGKYIISINPDDFDFAFQFRYGYNPSNWSWVNVVSGEDAADNEFLKFNRDEAGRITSVEWTFDGTDATKFRFAMSSANDSGIRKVVVRVDKESE